MNVSNIDDLVPGIEQAIKKISDTHSAVWYQNEVSICHRLASNLKEVFSGYDVDIELQKQDGRRPDIVIHKLGSNDDNLVVFQVKKKPSLKDVEDDLNKIYQTFFAEPYNYKYGVFISIDKLPEELPDFSIDRIRLIQVYGNKIVPAKAASESFDPLS